MPDRSRIPRLISTFNVYIISTSSYLVAGTPVTNGERLGLLPSDICAWVGLAEEWIPLYKLYSDRRNTRTIAIRNMMLHIISRAVEYDANYHLLDRIATSSQATVADLEVFRIKCGPLRKKTHTVAVTPIREKVRAMLTPIGGGVVRIKCFGLTAQRAGIVDGADCVQYLYKVGDTPPLSADEEGLKSGISSRASFVLDAGAASPGKLLFVYLRWFNTRHPGLAGSWSGIVESLIL